MSLRRRGLLLVAGVVVAVSLLFAVLIARSRLASQDRARTHATIVEVCRRVHRLDVALEQLVAASSTKAALLRTSYYRDHPEELRAALGRARHDLAILRKADCAATELAP